MIRSKSKTFVFNNKDKTDWQSKQDAKTTIGIRRGSRMLITAPPNHGKTTLLLNKIVQSDPPYEKIYIYQACPVSEEYASVDCVQIESLDQIPTPEEIKSMPKTLIILEDMDSINKKDLLHVDLLMRFSCSHFGCSVVILAQNAFSIPVLLRRKLDTFIMFLHNADTTFLMSNCVPIPRQQKMRIIDAFRNATKYDYLQIDTSNDAVLFNGDIQME
jgi:hypothetical protein